MPQRNWDEVIELYQNKLSRLCIGGKRKGHWLCQETKQQELVYAFIIQDPMDKRSSPFSPQRVGLSGISSNTISTISMHR